MHGTGEEHRARKLGAGHDAALVARRVEPGLRDRIAIAAYLGSSDAFDRAIVKFAFAYAEQSARDHAAAAEAARAGRLVITATTAGATACSLVPTTPTASEG